MASGGHQPADRTGSHPKSISGLTPAARLELFAMTESKIIVDEDWKAQVQAEKDAAQQEALANATEQPAAKQSLPTEDRPPPDSTEVEMPGDDDDQALPPATLSSLITSLTMQAWMTLGQIPDPRTGKGEVHLPYARHMIDTLEMLEQKTQGNRTPEEISLLSRTLHELRMAYVAVEREVKAAR